MIARWFTQWTEKWKSAKYDLQAKIVFVLIAVIVPTFVVITFIENKITEPILLDEMKQVGVNTARTLATEIAAEKLLSRPDAEKLLESKIQELLYIHPNVSRIDVLVKESFPIPLAHKIKTLASSVEEEPGTPPPIYALVDSLQSSFFRDAEGVGFWEVTFPIEALTSREHRGPKKVLGNIHVVVSARIVNRVVDELWKITGAAALFSVVTLLLALSFFLRRTIANDRKLQAAEKQNLELTTQLQETQRQLMNSEKLAVMGQLTASFAHELGTPLNAIDGHLHLLEEEIEDRVQKAPHVNERLAIIHGQISKIEGIVKGFLQSTAKPTSQRQLVDVNRLIDQTLSILAPRMESIGVTLKRNLDRSLGPLRMVPLDLEQAVLNILSNSLDSLQAKALKKPNTKLSIEVSTRLQKTEDQTWAQIILLDTGEGISKQDLPRVMRPFFTTKRPGEGTGLGLAICQELTKKYGGRLEIESKEQSWTRVSLWFPFGKDEAV